MTPPEARLLARDAQFDSHFGNRTGVRKPDSNLLRLDARYPVLLQTRHPRPVPGNRGENRFSGRVVGKWLCEMTSAFIIKEL